MRTRRPRSLLVALGVVLILVALAGPAWAATSDRNNDLVVLTGSLVVPDGETVDTAVIFDGPATIAGTVSQTLVVFNGDVEITGAVEKDVVVFNGDVVVRSGATVGGDVVSTSTPQVEQGATVTGSTTGFNGRLDFGRIGVASKIAWWVGFSCSALFLGLILLLLAPGLDGAIARVGKQKMGGAIGIGVAWFFLLPVAAVLLLITVVGIPLGLFTLLGLALLYSVGYVAGAIAVGRMLVKTPTSRYVAFLAGLGLLRLIALIPVVAGIAFTLAAILGFGVLVVAARRTKVDDTASAASPPPPMPAMPAT